MAPSKKTWLWIIGIFFAVCVVALIVVAGVGVYFVSRHVATERATMADAGRAFDLARARFKDQKPLIAFEALEHPQPPRPLADLPTSKTTPNELRILVWDPDEQRIVRLTLPFWLLRLGRRKIDVVDPSSGFDMDRLNLDVNELERIGPALVMDFRATTGERVLIWTQ
jgi:hypothetical protein